MSKRIEQIVRDPVTGDGVNAVTVTIKKVSDDSTVDDVATNSSGVATFSPDDIGNPGPVYAEFTDGTNVKRRSGEVIGQVGGFLWVDAINDAFLAFGESRVVTGALNELVCAANGANMNISIDTGVAILKDGFVYVRESSGNLTIGAADGSNPRIDRIILRLTRESQSTRGTVVLAVLAGTAAGSPAAPALTQTSTTWEMSLAQVRVDTGVTSIAVGKVTDERAFTLTPPSGLEVGDMLYINSSNKLARLDAGTSGQILQLSAGVPGWASQSTFGITVQEGDSSLDTDISTLDFDGADFALTESPENEANIKLHTHQVTKTAFDDTLRSTSSTVTYTDQVTVDIVLPTPGSWTIEAVGMARMASDGGMVDVRLSIDGSTALTTRSAPATGADPIMIRHEKTTPMSTSPKTVTMAFKSDTSGTVYMSNATLIVIATRVG